jgi:hypothetical protein
MGPPVGRARSPRAGPHNCQGPGDPLPQRPEAAPRSLGGLSARFSESFTSVNSVFLTPLANVVGLTVLVSSRLSEPRCNSGHRPAQRGRTPGGLWGARDGRGRTPARRRPFHARPVVIVGATLSADARLGGRRRHADARASRPEAHHEPGESEVAEAHCPASPTPLPPEEETSPGVCLRQSGLLGRRTPGPSPSSPGGRAGACYGLFPPSPATIILGAPGSQAH